MTPRQWRIVLSLAGAVVIVLGALGWSVWHTLYAVPASPLTAPPSPTPTEESAPTSTLPPAPTSPLAPQPTFDPAQAGTIAEQVSEARGWIPRWNTPLTPVDFHNMTVALYRQAIALPPFPQREQAALRTLGLWPQEPVLFEPRAQAHSCAAIYIPVDRQIYLRRDWEGSIASLKQQLAYGYARALADQIGELPQLEQKAETIDHRLALRALGDGDACFALARYANLPLGSISDEILPAITPRWDPELPLLSRLSRLPLTLGNEFTAQLYATDGISALNQALLRPPRSTEQILHPQQYLSGDEPQILPQFPAELGSGWSITQTETIGEALLGQVLFSWSVGRYGRADVVGWGGDLLQVWQGPNRDRVALWQLTWDSGLATGHFHAILQRLLPYPLLHGTVHSTPRPDSLPLGHWWAGSQGALYLWRRLDTVYVVWGKDEATVLSIARQLLEQR